MKSVCHGVGGDPEHGVSSKTIDGSFTGWGLQCTDHVYKCMVSAKNGERDGL